MNLIVKGLETLFFSFNGRKCETRDVGKMKNVRLYYGNLTPSENIKRAKSPAIDQCEKQHFTKEDVQ